MTTILVLVSTVIFSWALCELFSKPSFVLYVLDNPTHRSLHDKPKPRTGGLAILIAILVSWLVLYIMHKVEINFKHVILGIGLLSMISYLDDRYSISHLWRLLAHIIAAILLISSELGLLVSNHLTDVVNISALNIIAVLGVVWMINLYNFMDGMDGLAGGMSVIGFGCLGVLGLLSEDYIFAIASLVVAASNIGFLIHNFPPAKIFMGDVGSITMGYLMAFFTIWGMHEAIFTWWVPLIVFSPFIVDSTVTLFIRLFRGERVWEAHKSHNYQKLVQLGWSHHKTVLYCYTLMIAATLSATVMHIQKNELLNYIFLLAWVLIYGFIILAINRKYLLQVR